jgi:hypothetical protein
MPIIFQQSQNEICFTIWGAICQDISDWEYSVDEMVFNEQLATGSFHGQFPIDDEIRAVMQLIKAKGQIMPYYGVGGSRGSCAYIIQRLNKGYLIHVENTTTKESTEFSRYTNDSQRESLLPRFQTWLATNLRISEIAKPRFLLRINGKELQNLRAWSCWNESQALTARYVYEFGRVSLGRLGFTIKVTYEQSNEQIDVTDYGDW